MRRSPSTKGINCSRGIKYSCKISVSFLRLLRMYATESCIGSLRDTKHASPSDMAWVRGTTVHDSSLGSTFFSKYHLRLIGISPSLEKLKTKRRNAMLETSPNGGTSASPISTFVYL